MMTRSNVAEREGFEPDIARHAGDRRGSWALNFAEFSLRPFPHGSARSLLSTHFGQSAGKGASAAPLAPIVDWRAAREGATTMKRTDSRSSLLRFVDVKAAPQESLILVPRHAQEVPKRGSNALLQMLQLFQSMPLLLGS